MTVKQIIIKATSRLPLDIHSRVKELASNSGRSFNAQLIVLLKDALSRTRVKRE